MNRAEIPMRNIFLILVAVGPSLTLGGCDLLGAKGDVDIKGNLLLISAAGKVFEYGRTNSEWMGHWQVPLTRNFRMDRHEVTRKEYAERMWIPRPPADSLLVVDPLDFVLNEIHHVHAGINLTLHDLKYPSFWSLPSNDRI